MSVRKAARGIPKTPIHPSTHPLSHPSTPYPLQHLLFQETASEGMFLGEKTIYSGEDKITPKFSLLKLMNSGDIARYIEQTDGLSKPWMLIQWRLKKLQEQKSEMDADVYMRELAELHQSLMSLGQWWVGREDEVF